MTLCSLVEIHDILEENPASIFRVLSKLWVRNKPKDGDTV